MSGVAILAVILMGLMLQPEGANSYAATDHGCISCHESLTFYMTRVSGSAVRPANDLLLLPRWNPDAPNEERTCRMVVYPNMSDTFLATVPPTDYQERLEIAAVAGVSTFHPPGPHFHCRPGCGAAGCSAARPRYPTRLLEPWRLVGLD